MAAQGLEVFDRTLNITHAWLDEIAQHLGCDRPRAWQALGAVLHALRDRVPPGLAANLGAQLPLLVRGLYYAGFALVEHGAPRTLEGFLERVAAGQRGAQTVPARAAAEAVFHVIAHHLDPGQVGKLVHALPQPVQSMWQEVAAVALPLGRNPG